MSSTARSRPRRLAVISCRVHASRFCAFDCVAQPRATGRTGHEGASRPKNNWLAVSLRLLRAPVPGSAHALGCVSLGAGLLSQVEAKRAEPLPQKKTKRKKYEHDRK